MKNPKISAVQSRRWQRLVVGKGNQGCPKLHFKDVCKRDLKSLNITTDEWELLANDRAKWRSTVRKRLMEREQQYFKKPNKMKKGEAK